MIRLQNLWKSFDGDPVLRGIHLHVPEGKLMYIVGPSGTGKSVLMKHMLGLLRPDQGKVLVQGVDVAGLGSKEFASYRRKFGMLFQNSALFDDFSVFDNVAFPLREHTTLSEDEIGKKVVAALSRFGMDQGYEKLPAELSGGMRKRVGIARAIVCDPQILLFDEPTTGLDPVTRHMVDDLILDAKHQLNVTSVVISHDIGSALMLADELAFLYQGEIVFAGSASDFVACPHPELQRFLEAERRSARVFQEGGLCP